MPKYRESGMPSEDIWEGFYEPEKILKQLQVNKHVNTLIDVGCGYGTFLLPASRMISGTAIGIDIDGEMVESCRKKAVTEGLNNIVAIQGDISDDSTNSILKNYSGSIDYISLFNILHCEHPVSLLKATYSLLNSDGMIGVIHWKREDTPRGPSMAIRPTPEQIIQWANEAKYVMDVQVDLKPYHFGLVFVKR